jgi:hypothetical protein
MIVLSFPKESQNKNSLHLPLLALFESFLRDLILIGIEKIIGLYHSILGFYILHTDIGGGTVNEKDAGVCGLKIKRNVQE